jgi:hypothetical protein
MRRRPNGSATHPRRVTNYGLQPRWRMIWPHSPVRACSRTNEPSEGCVGSVLFGTQACATHAARSFGNLVWGVAEAVALLNNAPHTSPAATSLRQGTGSPLVRVRSRLEGVVRFRQQVIARCGTCRVPTTQWGGAAVTARPRRQGFWPVALSASQIVRVPRRRPRQDAAYASAGNPAANVAVLPV